MLVRGPLLRQTRSITMYKKFWDWTTQSRPTWRESIKEAAVLFTVFGVTGTSSVVIIRPVLKKVLGLEGSLMEGPNSYRIASILCVSPFYGLFLFLIGTAAGRHNFFARSSFKIIGRFVPSSLLHKTLCAPARLIRGLKS